MNAPERPEPIQPRTTTPGDPLPRRGGPRRVLIWGVGLAALAAAAWHWWPHPDSPPAGGRAAFGSGAPQAVGVAAATLADMPVERTGLGSVTPLATITVQSQIAGLLTQIGFTEGSIVKAGDFLAQIDPRPYEALLAQARGTLARDQGLLAQARLDEARYEKLNRLDSIARQQAEDQKYVVQQDEGSVAADQGAVQTQMVNLAFCRITSPVTGRVGLRQVDAGNYITPSLANGIVTVTQLQPISVIFTLPEDDLPAVMAQLAQGAHLAVSAFDRADATKLADGTLTAVDSQIDATTGTVKIRATFPNTDLALFPQQFVNAHLLIETHRLVVTVPNAALQTGSPGSFVYVVNGDNTVSVRPVKTGPATAQLTEITTGLAAGERVVIDGTDRLKEGARVMIPTAAPPAGSEATVAPATDQAATAAPPGGGDATATTPASGQPHWQGHDGTKPAGGWKHHRHAPNTPDSGQDPGKSPE